MVESSARRDSETPHFNGKARSSEEEVNVLLKDHGHDCMIDQMAATGKVRDKEPEKPFYESVTDYTIDTKTLAIID